MGSSETAHWPHAITPVSSKHPHAILPPSLCTGSNKAVWIYKPAAATSRIFFPAHLGLMNTIKSIKMCFIILMITALTAQAFEEWHLVSAWQTFFLCVISHNRNRQCLLCGLQWNVVSIKCQDSRQWVWIIERHSVSDGVLISTVQLIWCSCFSVLDSTCNAPSVPANTTDRDQWD